MNKLFIILILSFSFFQSCNVKDCFESTGKIIQQEFEVGNFERIKVGNEVSLILKYGPIQKVIIETGENLMNDVKVEVIGDRLEVEDQNTCNITRDYAVTKLIVTSPNITEIRSDTARLIKSDGVLPYDTLKIISEDFNEDALNIGDFDLEINCNTFTIVANGNSLFKIKGNTNHFTCGFYSGTSRLEAQNLLANHVTIVQKSTNDMLVYPIQTIQGTIYNLGDVIAYNTPPNIYVEELYTGSLIFN